jgi:hypothetical protein
VDPDTLDFGRLVVKSEEISCFAVLDEGMV